MTNCTLRSHNLPCTRSTTVRLRVAEALTPAGETFGFVTLIGGTRHEIKPVAAPGSIQTHTLSENTEAHKKRR